MSSDFMIESYIDTDPGRKRPNNEDAFAYFEPDQPEELGQSGRLYIVADGVGGAAKGEKASLYAAQKVLYEFFNDNTTDLGERLKRAMRQAGNDIYEHTQRSDVPVKMATTMVAASLRNGQLIVANVGDSRAYLIRSGQAEQITRDHTIAGEMLRNGEVDEAGAQQVKGKNKLTRSLGGEPDVHVDIFRDIPLRPGDRILLCSDGLARYALSQDIAQLASEGTPNEIVERCIDYANHEGGADNITVAVIQVGEPILDTTSVIKRGGEAPKQVDWDDAETVPWIEPKRYGQKHPALSRQQQVLLSVLGMVVIFMFVLGGFLLAQSLWPPPVTPTGQAVAGPRTPTVSMNLTVTRYSTPIPTLHVVPTVSATMTATPTVTPTSTITPTATITSARVPTASPTSRVIRIGEYVKVANADPQGLALRVDAGRDSTEIKRLPDETVMLVVGGPKKADGLQWWKLQTPEIKDNVGWAADFYLEVIDYRYIQK